MEGPVRISTVDDVGKIIEERNGNVWIVVSTSERHFSAVRIPSDPTGPMYGPRQCLYEQEFKRFMPLSEFQDKFSAQWKVFKTRFSSIADRVK
jgi:hypothetical protein